MTGPAARSGPLWSAARATCSPIFGIWRGHRSHYHTHASYMLMPCPLPHAREPSRQTPRRGRFRHRTADLLAHSRPVVLFSGTPRGYSPTILPSSRPTHAMRNTLFSSVANQMSHPVCAPYSTGPRIAGGNTPTFRGKLESCSPAPLESYAFRMPDPPQRNHHPLALCITYHIRNNPL